MSTILKPMPVVPRVRTTVTARSSAAGRVPQTAPLVRPDAVTQPAEAAEFSTRQIEEFRADDAAAGAAIARIMTTLFSYSVVIMLVVIFWTFRVVN